MTSCWGVAPSFSDCGWGRSLDSADVAIGAPMLRAAVMFRTGLIHPGGICRRSMAEVQGCLPVRFTMITPAVIVAIPTS